jgi:hypothetical protein
MPKCAIQRPNSVQCEQVSGDTVVSSQEVQTLSSSASQLLANPSPLHTKKTPVTEVNKNLYIPLQTTQTEPSTLIDQENMVNFECDPAPFLPLGAHVMDGGLHSA